MLDFIRVVLLLLLPPPPHFVSGFEPAAGGQAPNASVQLQPASKPQERWQSAPSNRLRPFVAAKIMFYRVSNLPTGRLQIPPCSCSLPASPKKWQSAQVTGFGLFVAAKIIFYRVSNLPSGRLQMRASVQLQPATKPQEGWQSPASALYGRQSHFLSGFEPAARQASNASVQLQPATKPQEGWQSPESHFLSGFIPAAGQASNASVQLQPATKPQEKVAKPPSNRLRPFVAAKVIFYRVSNLPPGKLQRRVAKPGFGLL